MSSFNNVIGKYKVQTDVQKGFSFETKVLKVIKSHLMEHLQSLSMPFDLHILHLSPLRIVRFIMRCNKVPCRYDDSICMLIPYLGWRLFSGII